MEKQVKTRMDNPSSPTIKPVNPNNGSNEIVDISDPSNQPNNENINPTSPNLAGYNKESNNSPDPLQIELLTSHTINPDSDSIAMPEPLFNPHKTEDTLEPEDEPKDPENPYEVRPDSAGNDVVETPTPATNSHNNDKVYESLDSEYEFHVSEHEFHNVGTQPSDLAIAPTNLINANAAFSV